MGVGYRHAPAALIPGETQHPLYRRLGGPQSCSGWARKISPPPSPHLPLGFEPQTVQQSQSRDTKYCKTFHIKKICTENYVHISRAINFEFLDHGSVSHLTDAPRLFFSSDEEPSCMKSLTDQKQIYSGERNSNSSKLLSREFICKAAYTVRTLKHSVFRRKFGIFRGIQNCTCCIFSHNTAWNTP
jgi:hypothetical protein